MPSNDSISEECLIQIVPRILIAVLYSVAIWKINEILELKFSAGEFKK